VRRVLTATALLATLVTIRANAQFPQPSGFVVENPVVRRIWAIGNDSSQLPRLAQALFDSLGPRLTASPGMTAAQNWLIATYSSWGITARKEQYGTCAAGGAARRMSTSCRRACARSKARCSRGARRRRRGGRCAHPL